MNSAKIALAIIIIALAITLGSVASKIVTTNLNKTIETLTEIAE